MHDRELVEATQAGDSEAFSALVERYQSQIYRLCYRMTGNSSNAQDLAHDAFVEAFLKIQQLRNPDKFAPWFNTLTRNLCRMWHRQNKRELEELSLMSGNITHGDDESVYQRMSWGLTKLSASHRLMLVLYYWEGLSYEEIAEFLQIPVGTVMSRLHRARYGLKQFMEKIAEEEEIPVTSNKEFGSC